MSCPLRLVPFLSAILVAPVAIGATAPVRWRESGPPARLTAVSVYDSAADRVLLLGGKVTDSGWPYYRMPTWEFSPGPKTWVQREIPTLEMATERSCAWDPARRRFWMFSPVHDHALQLDLGAGDTWREIPYEGTQPYDWQQVGFDPEHDRFLVLGRPSYPLSSDTLMLFSAPLDDTLRFSRIAVQGPLPRIYPLPGTVWDPGRGTFEVITAADGMPLVLWSLHTKGVPHWEQTSVSPDPGAGLPLTSHLTKIALDPRTGDLFLTMVKYFPRSQGILEAWRLARGASIAQWVPIPAPPDSSWNGTLVVDTRRHRLILQGGLDRQGIRLSATRSYDIATSSWEVLVAPIAPAPRSAYSIAYDHARDRVLMFGGLYPRTSSDWFGDLWARDSRDGSWSEITPEGPLPAPRAGAQLVEDEQRSRFLLVGGWQSYPPPLPTEIWQLSTDPPRWTPLATEGTPPDRVDAAFLDEARERLIVHGAVMQTFEIGEWELSLRGPATWRRLPVADGAKPPELCGFAFDRARDRAVIFGGYTGSLDPVIRHDELWGFSLALDTVKWERFSKPNQSIDRFFSYMNRGGVAVDPVRDRLVSFGGYGSTLLEWEMSDVATSISLAGPPIWTEQIPEFGGPPPTFDRALVYDPIRDSFVLFGTGYTATTFEWQGGFEGWPDLRARVISPYPPSIRLEWTAPNGPANVTVERRHERGAWRRIGAAHRARDGALHFTDPEVAVGATARYRLRWPAANGDIPAGEITVVTEPTTTSAVRIRDNPSRASIAMDLDLPRSGHVEVELLDLAGRRIRHESFELAIPGRRPFEFNRLGGVSPGLYFVRVTSPAGVRDARVSLLR